MPDFSPSGILSQKRLLYLKNVGIVPGEGFWILRPAILTGCSLNTLCVYADLVHRWPVSSGKYTRRHLFTKSFLFFLTFWQKQYCLKHFKIILNFHNSEPDHVLQRIVTTAMISDLHDLNYRENYNWHLHQMLWMPSDSLRSCRRCGTSLSDCVRVCIFASVNSQA